MTIRHLTYQEINKHSWDDCIHRAANRLIYAESIYLDHMCPEWEALVWDDYRAVMPLCKKRKWGFSYLYQPPFVQQMGIFSEEGINKNLQKDFLDAITEQVRFAECTLNYANSNLPKITGLTATMRSNFILSLQPGYEDRIAGMNSYMRQRFSRASKNNLIYQPSTNINQAISLYQSLYQDRLYAFTDSVYRQFEKLCSHYQKENRVIIREVLKEGSTKPLAMALFLTDGNRLYNMASSLTSEGKKELANYHLFHELIREFSGTGLLLDFEGSDVPGIAFFYEKMADENQVYPFIKYNKLPWPIRWLK